MKAIAYNIGTEEKEWLVIANYKRHDITFIVNRLTLETLYFSVGKKAIILLSEDPVNMSVIEGLVHAGIGYIITSSIHAKNIDLLAAKQAGLIVLEIPVGHRVQFETMKLVVDGLDRCAASDSELG